MPTATVGDAVSCIDLISKKFCLYNTNTGINYNAAQSLCVQKGFTLAVLGSDEERIALNQFNNLVQKDSKWDNYPAWIQGRHSNGSWDNLFLQQKKEQDFCDTWFEGCCDEKNDPDICPFIYFDGPDTLVSTYVTGCKPKHRSKNIIDHGCGLDWFHSYICEAPITSAPSTVPTTSTPTSAPTTNPTTSTPTTSAPSTVFEGHNFTLTGPNVSFNDFILNFTYNVGHSAEETSFTLYKENCSSTEGVSDILAIVRNMTGKVDVSLDKTAIGKNSLLVTKSEGKEDYSKGIIRFCIQVKTLFEGIAVTFLKTNVNLAYDLTKNSFEIIDNTIRSNSIQKTNITVSTKYNVTAFRCTTNSFLRVESPPGIEQDQLLAICLEPTEKSKAAVEISNFEMKFEQNGDEVLPQPATIGPDSPLKSYLSDITKDGQTYRVVARLVTALFDGGTNFDIKGNAYLQFKEDRNLISSNGQALRSLQKSADNLAGESSFGMDIKIQKTSGYSDEGSKNSFAISLIGAALALTIGFILYKKLV